MHKEEFAKLRKRLGKTQSQMAALLGTSLKAVHSYEQGWRAVPGHVERQLFFLISRMRGRKVSKPCWVVRGCSPDRKRQCPAWEYRAGTLCWFINGTVCEGTAQKDWQEKMKICRNCKVLTSLL
jgi:hypothetical protein